ncbi:MAG: Ig-like domain-containing protein [Mobilitalea sp.]
MKKIRFIFSFILIFSIATFSTSLFTKDIVTAQAASNIQISDKSLALELGHYKTIKIYGTSAKASWSSSNSWVASVSSSGKVTAKAAGTATITASVNGKKINCKITVIRISKKALTMLPGKTSTLAITGTNSEVAWDSSNKKIANVSGSGKITANAPGTTTITASVDGKEITCKITVVGINHKAIVLELGGWSGYVKTLKINDTTSIITWSSSNKSIATVSSNGKVTAKRAGSATITASFDGIKFTSTVKVLKMSTKALNVKKGDTKTLEIFGTTSAITWTSNKNSVATVSSDGTVTPVAVGSATITGYVDGRKVTSKITVLD